MGKRLADFKEKICKNGTPCGNSCISKIKNCLKSKKAGDSAQPGKTTKKDTDKPGKTTSAQGHTYNTENPNNLDLSHAVYKLPSFKVLDIEGNKGFAEKIPPLPKGFVS